MSRKTIEFFHEVRRALRDQLGEEVSFIYKPNHVQHHMYSVTPTFVVKIGESYLGHIRWDKSMTGPRRYFSLYTTLTGGWGANGRSDRDDFTVNFVVRIFKLVLALQGSQENRAALLAEGEALGISEGAVRSFFRD